jgi:aryl-alcohol dehydrogenase-like predicted oxidoreductase
MDRRHFVKQATVAAGFMAINPLALKAETGAGKKYISERVMLGNTGIEVSRMAMGTGTNGYASSSNQTRKLGLKGLADLLKAGYDKGVFFWDSADQYGTHPHVKEALKMVPREKVVLLSKTHASTEKEMLADLDRFRKELGTDYIDVVLLHCMMNKNWPAEKQGAMGQLEKARESKIIRAHGVSCHTLEALQSAAASPWVQVDLARINQAGADMDAGVSTITSILRQMKQSGKAVMGMKLFGAGKLTGRIDECLRFALAQEYLDCFTIGIESYDQLLDLEKRLPALS